MGHNKSLVFISLLRDYLGNIKGNRNRRRKPQIVTCRFFSGLSLPPLASDEEVDFLSVEDSRWTYFQKATDCMLYYGSSNSIFNLVLFSAEMTSPESAKGCTHLKFLTWLARVLLFVQVWKNYEGRFFFSSQDRGASSVCDRESSSELCFLNGMTS